MKLKILHYKSSWKFSIFFSNSGPGDDVIITDYGVYSIPKLSMTHDTAEAVCRVSGGHLAVLESRQEFDSLEPHVPDSEYHRIGGRDVTRTLNFIWVTKGLKFSETFAKWAGGRPVSVNSNPNHRCVSIKNQFWVDVVCDINYPFVCEY